MKQALIALLVASPLAACMAPQHAPVYEPFPAQPMPAAGPAPEPLPVAASGGFQSREPDVCGAQNHRSAIGQPASAIPSLGLSRPYRVVEYRGIESQEYDPQRIVFRLDQMGNISNIDCG